MEIYKVLFGIARIVYKAYILEYKIYNTTCADLQYTHTTALKSVATCIIYSIMDIVKYLNDACKHTQWNRPFSIVDRLIIAAFII